MITCNVVNVVLIIDMGLKFNYMHWLFVAVKT
jgi:hypothetical protein